MQEQGREQALAKKKNETCPHEDAHQLPGGAYAAPIGQCRCCGFHFMYIGMGSHWTGDDGTSESKTSTPDSTLCVACGGTTVHEHWKDGQLVSRVES